MFGERGREKGWWEEGKGGEGKKGWLQLAG